MNTLIQDIRYSLRVFRRSPGVSVVIVLTLALGIGVNSVVYGLLESMFLRPLPFQESSS